MQLILWRFLPDSDPFDKNLPPRKTLLNQINQKPKYKFEAKSEDPASKNRLVKNELLYHLKYLKQSCAEITL